MHELLVFVFVFSKRFFPYPRQVSPPRQIQNLPISFGNKKKENRLENDETRKKREEVGLVAGSACHSITNALTIQRSNASDTLCRTAIGYSTESR